MGWPRLSETLPHPAEMHRCQGCGRTSCRNEELQFWQEHDDNDKPEQVAIYLCLRCSDAIIEEHPRLYRVIRPHEPFPGVMEACEDCSFRDGFRCTHRNLKANGGPGLEIRIPQPAQAFVCKRGGRGGLTTIFAGPPLCMGRVVLGPRFEFMGPEGNKCEST